VGKGSGKRAYTSNAHGVHRPESNHLIIVQFWESEEKAFEMEKWYIDFFGRKDNGTGILRNLTDGGENPPNAKGIKRSAEFCRKISERQVGIKPSNALLTAAKVSNTKRFLGGWRFPPKTGSQIEKIAASKRGKSLSDNHKTSLREAMQKREARGSYSKTRGVSWYKGRNPKVNGRWRATIYVKSKQVWLGYFLTEESASTAVMVAREKHGLPPLP
jgi:hypothetical protein